jgi:glycosyltransferase involved in cell wall biosynthesis
MPKTVCFYINFSKSYTGGPQVVRNLTQRLDRDRFCPVVITNRESPLCDDLARQNVTFEILPQTGTLGEIGGESIRTPQKRFWNSFRAIGYNYSVLRLLRKHGADLIWARNVKGVLLTGFAAKILRIPLIWDIGMEKNSTGVTGRLHKLGFRLADKVVTEGSCVAPSIFPESVCEKYKQKIRVIRSGIPDDRVQRILDLKSDARDKPEKDSVSVINIASVCERKNQRLLVDAIIPLMQKNENLSLNIVGPFVEEDYKKLLEDMIANAGLESRIQLLGWRSDALELLAESDIFALASTVEGVPYSILEAMYAEVAIVSTPCGGVPDVVADKETGLIVHDYSVELFRNHLEQLIESDSMRRTMSKNALAFVNDHHTSTSWSREYMTLFDELLGN